MHVGTLEIKFQWSENLSSINHDGRLSYVSAKWGAHIGTFM